MHDYKRKRSAVAPGPFARKRFRTSSRKKWLVKASAAGAGFYFGGAPGAVASYQIADMALQVPNQNKSMMHSNSGPYQGRMNRYTRQKNTFEAVALAKGFAN